MRRYRRKSDYGSEGWEFESSRARHVHIESPAIGMSVWGRRGRALAGRPARRLHLHNLQLWLLHGPQRNAFLGNITGDCAGGPISGRAVPAAARRNNLNDLAGA